MPKQPRSYRLRTMPEGAVMSSRTRASGNIHVDLWSARPDDADRLVTLDLTPAEAVALRASLTWWLDPNSGARFIDEGDQVLLFVEDGHVEHVERTPTGSPRGVQAEPPALLVNPNPNVKPSKAERRQRARFINAGAWNDRILVFLDREIYTERVTMVAGDPERALLVGRDRATDRPVEGTFDPCDVTRVLG